VMGLATPQSAILSAVNLQRAHHHRADPACPARCPVSAPIEAAALRRRRLWIYGVGGIIVPFNRDQGDRPDPRGVRRGVRPGGDMRC
jgi:high-affinity K+ transport system ATPase subunit B